VRRGAVISSHRARRPGTVLSSEGQHIVQELDTSGQDAFRGRRRAPSSAVRRMATRLGIAALGVLLATGLGAVTADVLGLTDLGQVASESGPRQGIPAVRETEPRPRPTMDLTTRPSPAAPSSDALPAEPELEDAPTAAATEPANTSTAAREPRRAPARTVRKGDTCPTVGQAATTARGDVAVCTASRGNGPNKWRAR
jgi:hypothetical protein